MTADVRQLQRMAFTLRASSDRAAPEMVRIVSRGALNVKSNWRDNAIASSGRHARAYPFAVTYDVTPIPGGASAEIGPDKGKRQGALGNLLEYGSVNNPPHNDGGRALESEDPRFTGQVWAMTLRVIP